MIINDIFEHLTNFRQTLRTTMDEKIDENLIQLAQCEREMDKAEREAEIFRIKQTQSIFEKRRKILTNIPKFWYIILAENDDFSDYVSVEDLKYLEAIDDIYVDYKVVNGNPKNPKDFSISIGFNDKLLVPTQTITKQFEVEVEDGEEKITSHSVDIVWPQELDLINPKQIKQIAKDENRTLNGDEKKKYRLGMKSFFLWFYWTGKNPGKEFRNGEDLTRLIIEDIFPYAVKYYTEALPGADGDDNDTSDPEELDLDDDEDEEDEYDYDDDDDDNNDNDNNNKVSQKRKSPLPTINNKKPKISS